MSEVQERVAGLIERDAFVQSLGITLVDAREGRVTIAMDVTAGHINFHGGCHGGVIFAFADTAFGLASNSGGTVSIGIDTHTAFIRGVREGDLLTATAEEISRSRKVGVYRVDVSRDGETVSTFTGTVHVTGRSVDESMKTEA